MHHVAEVLIPPTENIPEAIKQVFDSLRRRDENDEPYDIGDWWDWYVIGGRWSGNKLLATLDPKKLEEFEETLRGMNLTVAGLVAGKQELRPASQEVQVDALWRETFPGRGDKCPLFKHGRDQYAKDTLYADDLCKVVEIPKALTCERLILAGPHRKHKDQLGTSMMLATSLWNGFTHQDTKFSGNVLEGIGMIRGWYKDRDMEVPDLTDYLCVTVDYHN